MTADPLPVVPLNVTEKIRSGEYFREARMMYDLRVHDAMVERYFYIAVTLLALVILVITYTAEQSLYPLERKVPFIVSTDDVVEEVPRIRSLLQHRGDDPARAVLYFLAENYVVMRESYDADTFERNISGARSQSNETLAAELDALADPRNSESPRILYQRQATRQIDIISVKKPTGDTPTLEVVYAATLTDAQGAKKTYHQADIAFQYEGIGLDEKTGKPRTIHFMVTGYATKRLQDE